MQVTIGKAWADNAKDTIVFANGDRFARPHRVAGILVNPGHNAADRRHQDGIQKGICRRKTLPSIEFSSFRNTVARFGKF